MTPLITCILTVTIATALWFAHRWAVRRAYAKGKWDGYADMKHDLLKGIPVAMFINRGPTHESPNPSPNPQGPTAQRAEPTAPQQCDRE